MAPHEAGRRNPAPADRFILPSRTLRPEQRVGIYADAYLARLVEVLQEDFPAVSRFLGRRAFHATCRAYLERFPSRSRSLNPLGRRLPEFLSSRPAARDLARVEVAMSEVFDAEGVAPLQPSDFSKIAPGRLAEVRLEFVPAFRLLELDHAADPYVDAARRERQTLPRLRRTPTWIAVYRKEFQVWRLDLKKPAHAALEALHRSCTVSRAVAAAAKAWTGTPQALESQLRRWFGEWASEGFFLRVIR